MPVWPVTVEQGSAALDLSDAVYPLAAVHGAALLFLDRAWVRLEAPRPGRTRRGVRPKRVASDEAALALGGEVLNELLHQALRLDVGARTEKLRELVIGKAVMSAEAAADEGVAFQDDPLGIGK